MLIDLHAHTSGISKCCRYTASKVLESAYEAGIDGIVLTNHYQKSYIDDDKINSFIDKYIEEFYFTQALGEQSGVKVFGGIEVTMELYPNVHMLIYGVNTDFLKSHPLIFDYTQKDLYTAVKDNNGVLIQAHPFRNGTTVLDTDFLDGIEINCHPLYNNSYSQEILNIADENRLVVTCGGDFHADTYRPKCGMYLPDSIVNSCEVGKYIENAKKVSLCIHEPNTTLCKKIDYYREF